ncbi:MAG: kinase, partial [Desulfovibrio sp.]|nr:kinase [Desulfovibrio sp.]
MREFSDVLARKREGSLKIYLGYAAGVGKTCAMLREAHNLLEQGFDVVAAYVEPHDRPDTRTLLDGIETLPPLNVSQGGAAFPEMDVEALIRRAPQIALVDELAHTNAPGSQREKRYQDVLEILSHGINVIGTLNVQHLESVAERVQEATGVAVRERLPDAFLARADQVVTVDVSKEDLRERLRQGKIYKPEQAERALRNFFSYENLSFLRELCLREASGDQMRK